jgi:hypothetical protein
VKVVEGGRETRDSEGERFCTSLISDSFSATRHCSFGLEGLKPQKCTICLDRDEKQTWPEILIRLNVEVKHNEGNDGGLYNKSLEVPVA